MGNWKAWLLVVLALVGSWAWWARRPVARPDGMLAPDEPAQVDFESRQTTIAFKGAALRPLATFALTARVLGRDDYRFDAGADLAPTDLVFGWGPMSDSAVLRHIDISQGARFYRWHTSAYPIPRRAIETHSANMHLIPADAGVARVLKRVRPGDLVTLAGLLVEADKPGGWRWRSSLTRGDTGDGACELVFVQQLNIGPR